jgi:hypothetical protein
MTLALAFWILFGLLAAITTVWIAVWAFAAVMVYGAIVLERLSDMHGLSNCLFYALRKFLDARKDPDRFQVALVLQWSPRYWGPHIWFARRIEGRWVEEYIPKLRRQLVPPTMTFRGRVRRKDTKT